jgi:NitT/TauT family transport system substrate-binding protein
MPAGSQSDGAPGQSGTLTRVRVNIFNTSSNLPLLVAVANGYFAHRQLEIEIQTTPNSDAQRAGLAAGQFEIAHAAVDNAVAMVESAGQDVVIVCGGDAGMNEFMVRPEIGSMDDLRGKALAVDAPNTAYALVAKKILKLHGLLEHRDYAVRLAGGTGPRSAAMVSDTGLAAGMVNPPFSFLVREKGLKSLGTQHALLGPYQATGAFVARAWGDAHADVLQRYLAAYIEGQRRVMNPSFKDEMIDLLTSAFKLSPSAAGGTYLALVAAGSGLAPDAQLDLAGFEAVLALRAEMEGMWGGRPPAPAKYLDLTHYHSALRTARATWPLEPASGFQAP